MARASICPYASVSMLLSFVVAFGVYSARFVDKTKLLFTILCWIVFTSSPTVPFFLFWVLPLQLVTPSGHNLACGHLDKRLYSEVHNMLQILPRWSAKTRWVKISLPALPCCVRLLWRLLLCSIAVQVRIFVSCTDTYPSLSNALGIVTLQAQALG